MCNEYQLILPFDDIIEAAVGAATQTTEEQP